MSKRTRTLRAAATAALLTVAMPCQALTIYVAPSGNDGWTGRISHANPAKSDGPLATLAGARDAIRKLNHGAPPAQPIDVVFADGTYAIASPVAFSPVDSGTETCPIIYKAAPNSRPLFSGGVPIVGWTPQADGTWTAPLPPSVSGEIDQLWANGQRLRRARWPSNSLITMSDAKQNPPDAVRGSAAEITVSANSSDLAPLSGLDAEQIGRIRLVAFYAWDNAIANLATADAAAGTLQFQFVGMQPWNKMKHGSMFYLDNVPAGMAEPGAWMEAKPGVVGYRPRPGEHVESMRFVAPVVERLLLIDGDPATGKPVEHIAFQGLSFGYTKSLMANGARDVTFDDCEIAHTGEYALWLRNGCTNDAVRRTYFHDLGAGGVRIGDGALPTEVDATGAITVDNCIIRDGGHTFPCAVGVWIGQSSGNQITHNEIADLFYTGVSIGWTWGYKASGATHNRIAYNHIHHIGWRCLSDMGAVYTLGVSPGTSIDHNVVHDIYTATYGGWGLYTDEGSSGIVLEDNLVYDCDGEGFHQHYGQDNVFRNNILALNYGGGIRRTRIEDHVSFTASNNIILTRSPHVAGADATKPGLIAQDNLYFAQTGPNIEYGGDSLAVRQAAGNETGSLAADPLFEDVAKRDFRLKPDSPALKLGFKPFDPSEAGVYGDAAWKKLAAFVAYPVAPAPPTGPLKVP
jgi:hypothetical protein